MIMIHFHVCGLANSFVVVQTEHRLKQVGMPRHYAEVLGGIMGGVSQGVFMTPTQRLKTIVMTDPRMNAEKAEIKGVVNTSKALMILLKQEGIGSLFNGLGPMMAKRGMDWGLRFYFVGVARRAFQGEDKTRKLSMLENTTCAIIGGMGSTLTMPMDTLVANCQKSSAGGQSWIQVARGMWQSGGPNMFVKGWSMRALHASYHTVFMVAVGDKVYDLYKAL